jgi:hypothetical protein
VNESVPGRAAPHAVARTGHPSGRTPLALVATVFAVAALVTLIFFRAGPRGVQFDSYHYYELSRIVASEGLWGLRSTIRTYGYPLFLAGSRGFLDPGPDASHAAAAAAQVALHLGLALYAGRVAARVFREPRLFGPAFAALALNPILLLRATEMLSDSVSASLVGFAVFVSLPPGRPAARAFGAFLCAGLAAMVRPANVALLPALAIVWLVRARRHRERAAGPLAAAVAGAAIALLPQLASNVRAYGRWTPLVVEGLYRDQAAWGVGMLKYGTSLVPGRVPQIEYINPFLAPDGSSPAGLARRHPVAYAKTLAAHAFGMLDQDFPYTYVENLRPPARWPLSLANYAFFFLALAGLGLGISGISAPGDSRLYFLAAVLASGALVAIYLPVAVESRFSAPLYSLLTPAAVHAVLWLSRRRSGTVVAAAIAGGGFVAACVQLSRWMTTLIR